LFAVVLVLRLLQSRLPWTARSDLPRIRLRHATYTVMGLETLILIVNTVVSGEAGAVLFVVIGVAFIQMLVADARVVSLQRSIRQTEFVWLLSRLIRKPQNLPLQLRQCADGFGGDTREQILQLADTLQAGRPMSELAVPQGLIPESLLIEIHNAARVGQLPEMLMDATQRQTRRLAENSVVPMWKSCVIYFASVWSVTLLVQGFLFHFIVPKLMKIYEDFNVELSPVTSWMIHAGRESVSPVLGTLASLTLALFVGWQFRSRWVMFLVDRLKYRHPRVFAPLVLRTLSRVVATGQPLEFGLQGLLNSNAHWGLKRRAGVVLNAVERGDSVWPEFVRQKILRPQEAQVLESAADVGNLPWAMDLLADEILRRWQFRADAWSIVLAPALIAVPVVLVVVPLLVILQPMLELAKQLC